MWCAVWYSLIVLSISRFTRSLWMPAFMDQRSYNTIQCVCVCTSQRIYLHVSCQYMPLLLTMLPYGSFKDFWLCTPRLLLRPHLKQLSGGNLLIFNELRQLCWFEIRFLWVTDCFFICVSLRWISEVTLYSINHIIIGYWLSVVTYLKLAADVVKSFILIKIDMERIIK